MGRQTKLQKTSKSAAERRILALANNPPTIDLAIMLIAEKLLVDVPHPPTDLRVLGRRLNVSGFDSEKMPLSGELRRDGDQFRVAYSSYLSQAQRRFTIAHELGHAVFAMSGRNYPRGGEEVERICDMFAAEFLMPTAEFQARLGSVVTAESLLVLASLYRCPLQSLAIRAAEFQPISVFMIEKQEVRWSYGAIVVRDGSFSKNGFYMKNALESVKTNSAGNITFVMSGELMPTEGHLSWVPVANGTMALCVLQKSKQTKLQMSRASEPSSELIAG